MSGTASSQPGQSGGLFGAAATQPTQTGGLFGASAAQPAKSGGLFGASAAQPTQTGGLFGASTTQPTQTGGLSGASATQPTGGLFGSTPSQASGGLFGSTTTAQPASGGLFGATTGQPAASGGLLGSASQPSQTTGLFGAATSQTASTSGLFGTATSQSAPSGQLFGSISQPNQGGGLLATATSQPGASGGLFGATSSQPVQGGGLFGNMPSKPNQGVPSNSQAPQQNTLLGGLNQNSSAKPATTLNFGQQSTLAASAPTSSARIDLEHLRPTTKFDQLTEELQKEIVSLDTAILNEISRCNEVSTLLPVIAASGSNISNDVDFVTQKLEEVESGLENDAEDIQDLKENIVKKDTQEAKICFREVDRLKMPSQYQASVTGPIAAASAGTYGVHGLSGWWNHPQTLQRSMRGASRAGGTRSLPLPGDEDEDDLAGGPANLVDFFDRRTEEMRKTFTDNKSLLTEIEEFVMGVESKIAAKQREVMANDHGTHLMQGGNDQIDLLRFVFGEFERSLYEVADKVGAARDGVKELVIG